MHSICLHELLGSDAHKPFLSWVFLLGQYVVETVKVMKQEQMPWQEKKTRNVLLLQRLLRLLRSQLGIEHPLSMSIYDAI